MKILILEDSDYRIKRFREECVWHDYLIVQDAGECNRLLNEYDDWQLLFLDHDLNGESTQDTRHINTGSQVVRWMLAKQYNVPTVIHSMNVPAAISMESNLLSYMPFVYRIPWITLHNQLDSVLKTVEAFYARQNES